MSFTADAANFSFSIQQRSLKPRSFIMEGILEVVDIIKSPEDTREYRGLVLDNGLKALLISDPTTEKASAAMDVHVGSMSDPDGIEGLAHFCEHMLFLGTSKYPDEHGYSQYLSEHGGSSNAYTTGQHTKYYFDIRHECLKEALDRFAQFFISPLFNADAKDREVKAIESESQKNLLNDAWRIHLVDKATCKKGHPWTKFQTGNLETLETIPNQKGIDIREELLKFHDRYYSSNIMCLAVIGQETLDQLQEIVVSLFKQVVNKEVEIEEFSEHPYGPEQVQVKVLMAPVKDLRDISLYFPFPDLRKHYESKPEHYVAHLIGHEGDGSLLSVLKNKGWVNSLVAGVMDGAKGFMFFTISMGLSEEGFDHVDDIITHVFQYINLLKREGPKEWIYNEVKALDEMGFRFQDKESPRSVVTRSVTSMQVYPFHDVRYGPSVSKFYKPDLITWVQDMLVPSKLRVKLISRAFTDKTECKEPWYGTGYSIEKFSPELIKTLENLQPNDDLYLPSPNEFIPTDFSLKCRTNPEPSDVPILIKDTKESRVWFKQDTMFFLPKTCLAFDFVSPLAYSSPKNCNMTKLYTTLLTDSLTEFSYAASLAGIEYNLKNSVYGLELSVGGYSDKQSILLKKIIERMVTFKVDPERFKIIKENLTRQFANFEAEQPHTHAIFFLSYLLEEQAWTKAELLDSIHDITDEQLQAFIPELLGQLYIESEIVGNVTKEDALQISSMVEEEVKEHMKFRPLLPLQHCKHREIKLPDGDCYLFERRNLVQNNSCIELYYQTDLQSTRTNVVIELFVQLINEHFFNQLRTQEQLGYIVFCGVRRGNGAQGVRFLIQSEKDPQEIDERVEVYINNLKQYLADLSEEEFKNNVEALAVKKLEKPKKLSTESLKFWVEITSKQYNFNRADIEVAELKKLEKNDILSFYEDLIASTAPRRHKMAVHILSSTSKTAREVLRNRQTNNDKAKTKVQVIDDIVKFKCSVPLFPMVLPYNGISYAETTASKL